MDFIQDKYQFVSHLSKLFYDSSFICIQNSGACPLMESNGNHIHTYDTQNVTEFIKTNHNEILNSSIIYVAISQSNGLLERDLYQFIVDNTYDGILLCDNVWSSKHLRDNFWSIVKPEHKRDLTESLDMGAIMLSPDNKNYMNNTDWTLVTAYFDLTAYSDNTEQYRAKEYYFSHSLGALSLPYNMVIYCDESSLSAIKLLRPTHLHDKTIFIVDDFDKLNFVGHDGYENKNFKNYRDNIVQNRKNKPYQFDPRNTASYYLFCMARYLLLKRTIMENPFKSTHFAWINICIERMGYKNLINLDNALSLHRDRFSTCYIDYIPPSLVNNLPVYFQRGLCSMCSGFFTGNHDYMYRVCHLIESQFLEYLEKGYGHADEQLYSPVYFKNPDLFEHYYGDYQEMITNYCQIRDHPQTPISCFMKNSFDHENYEKCLECCKFVLNSHVDGHCVLNYDQTQTIFFYKGLCEMKIYEKQHTVINPRNHIPVTKNLPTVITLIYDVGNPAHIENLLLKSKQWIDLKCPLIIWTDDTYFDRLKDIFMHKDNCTIYKRNIHEFDVNQKLDKITKLYRTYNVNNRNATKDTVLYHMLMYSRPQMWRESVIKNPYNTRHFICIDYGLTRFTDQLSVIEQWHTDDKLKVLLINPYLQSDPPPKTYFTLTYHNIAGGLLTGKGENILIYADLFYKELDLMIQDEWCQLDEALTATIARKHPTLFDYFYGDYCSIISNYEKTVNMTNINNIINKYLNNHQHGDAQKVLDTIDYKSSASAMSIFVDYSIITNYYTLNQQLNPVVIDLINNPMYYNVMLHIVSNHRDNLNFYNAIVTMSPNYIKVIIRGI